MKKSIILMNKNFFIHHGEQYDFDKFNEMKNLLKSNLKIIILEEDLYVKQFTNEIKIRKIYEFVDYKINNDFPQNGDILYDFERKNNLIAIYSIKGAKRIEKLSKNAKNIEVKPIQFIIKEIMMKILKDNNLTCRVLIKFNKHFYFVSFKEGLFYYGFVKEDKDLVLNEVIKNNDLGEFYVDENIVDILPPNNKFKIIKMNIGELINEKIFEKQRFYTRKIL